LIDSHTRILRSSLHANPAAFDRAPRAFILAQPIGFALCARAKYHDPSDDSLTWHALRSTHHHIGLQYESTARRSAITTRQGAPIPFDKRHESVLADQQQLEPDEIGLRAWSRSRETGPGLFALETWFNPQPDASDSLKSLTLNNASPGQQSTNMTVPVPAGVSDWLRRPELEQLRHLNLAAAELVADGVNALDPNQAAPAFSLLGASGIYAGAVVTRTSA